MNIIVSSIQTRLSRSAMSPSDKLGFLTVTGETLRVAELLKSGEYDSSALRPSGTRRCNPYTWVRFHAIVHETWGLYRAIRERPQANFVEAHVLWRLRKKTKSRMLTLSSSRHLDQLLNVDCAEYGSWQDPEAQREESLESRWVGLKVTRRFPLPVAWLAAARILLTENDS